MSLATNENFSWLGRLLQASDSAFPTGGYAHSYGLEQVVQLGLVRDAETMRDYLAHHLWPALIHFDLPLARLAREAAQAGDLEEVLALDAIADAAKTARELREASRATGRRRLLALSEGEAAPILSAFATAVEEGRAPGHHAVVYAVALADMPEDVLLGSWAFQALAGACFAAPKLLRVGQDTARRLLTEALTKLADNIVAARTIPRDDLGWFDPLVEIASMQHEIAHERLFIS